MTNANAIANADITVFKDLVVQMVSSTENATRNEAEKTYNEIPMQTRAHYLLQLYMDANLLQDVSFELKA
jgi:hypothetical protein